MAPSRGSRQPISTENLDDTAVNQQSSSALANARRNFGYLLHPTTTSPHERPARLRTRALLRSVRYLAQFIIWRLVRWAKYAAVGALAAAIGATAVGGVVSGAAWILAPPSIGASIIAASVWGVGKYAARRLHSRWKTTGMDDGEIARERQSDSNELGLQAMPW